MSCSCKLLITIRTYTTAVTLLLISWAGRILVGIRVLEHWISFFSLIRASSVVNRPELSPPPDCDGSPRLRLRAATPLLRRSGGRGIDQKEHSVRSPPYSTNCHAWAYSGPPTAPTIASPRRRERLRKRPTGGRVQIVTNQHQTLHMRIVLVQQLLDAPRPLDLAALWRDPHSPPTAQNSARSQLRLKLLGGNPKAASTSSSDVSRSGSRIPAVSTRQSPLARRVLEQLARAQGRVAGTIRAAFGGASRPVNSGSGIWF